MFIRPSTAVHSTSGRWCRADVGSWPTSPGPTSGSFTDDLYADVERRNASGTCEQSGVADWSAGVTHTGSHVADGWRNSWSTHICARSGVCIICV